ncbi:superoxide dismutase [Cu-Zn] isoform X2 [Lingula anatina]|uniref:Superoxide dismutase [Cu-Zn] n=1 Tax=Lingula anatina TaxID=7574 RepID=A0A1S3JI77_LINAN|nr:superoxide dismutase [Cu-Zn] isoform X2 [Lingula anatina]|eukprot:XP_013410092.1 superoxide dismutase [Cu-Zn] isoform X2 [Lingula anatina]
MENLIWICLVLTVTSLELKVQAQVFPLADKPGECSTAPFYRVRSRLCNQDHLCPGDWKCCPHAYHGYICRPPKFESVPKTESRIESLAMQGVFAHCALKPNMGTPEPDRVNVHGNIDMIQRQGVLEVRVNISGLPLDGSQEHGLHVHAFGDLSGGCGSTKGHYNPTGVTHGAPTDVVRHIGDWGNVPQDKNGQIVTSFFDGIASLVGKNNIVGRAIVLHTGKDDLGRGGNAASLANGNAGPRLGCCVIGITNGQRVAVPAA